jgi:FemAB family protein
MQAAVDQLLDRVGLDATLRRSDAAAWETAWAALPYQPVGYAASMLDYQHAYVRGAGWQVEDLSLILRLDSQPCGLWPLSLGGPPGAPRLSSAGAPVLAPVFARDLSPRSVKKICSRALALLRALCMSHALPSPALEQGAQPCANMGGATEWHQQLMGAGAAPSVRHDLFADLRPSLADIRTTYRKSFRPLINVGLRSWPVFVMDHTQPDSDVWSQFKELHRNVAGRSTRSDDTWTQQFHMITAGTAFLVGLRDPAQGSLVGAGFFQCTRDEGLYAVGAYDRSLFDKPLGHAVQQRAIETMKERGVAWYRIGERHYAQDIPAPSDKQVAIAAFKHGFASHLFCRFEFALPQLGGESSAADTQA